MTRMILKTTIAALLAGAALPAAAEAPAAPDTTQWKCEACPFAKGYDADASLGAIYADGANASYGRYNGLDEDQAYVDANASGTWRSESGLYAKYAFSDLGLDTRAGSATFGREGKYDLRLRYDAIPWRRYDSTVTPFSGNAVQSLPAGWVRGTTTGSMTQLARSLGERDIGTLRQQYGISGRYLMGTNWSFFGGYTRETKDGDYWQRAAFLNSAVELAKPIEYETDTFQAGTAWNTSRASFRLAYSGSWFRNQNTALTFQNPYTPILPAAATGAVALAPDNTLQQLGLNGNYRFDLWNGAFTYAASYGELKQDNWLLPVSTAANAARPAESLDGKVKIGHYGMTLAFQPVSKLTLRGAARYDDRQDDTKPLAIAYVVTDTFPGGTETTPRYDYTRTRFDGSADYALFNWFKVGGALQWDRIDRSEQEIDKTTEDGGYLRGVFTPWGSFAVTLKGGQFHREASGFNPALLDPSENPLLRKYNLANRDRTFYEAIASWNASEAITVSFQAKLTDDAYRRSPLGLTDGATDLWGGSVSWAISDAITTYVDGSYQKMKSKQLGQARPGGSAWEARNEDEFWNAGLGGRWTVSEKLAVTADWVYAESTGTTKLVAGATTDEFPQLKTKLNSVKVGGHYQLTPKMGLHARVAYESADEDTWLLDNVGPATVSNLLSLGMPAYTHDVFLVAFTFDYRFGNVATPAPKSE